MKKLVALLFVLVAGSLVGTVAHASAPLPVPEIERLPNGLEVVWFLNDKLPVVDLGVLVKSGHRDDPAGKSGTAQLLSALLDRGAGGMKAQEIARAIDALGGSRYAAAGEDTLSVGVHGLAPDADALLGILGKLVVHPEFPATEFTRERDRFFDRWNHIGDSGETLASLAYQRALLAGSEYGRGGFLTVKEFASITREDVTKFYRRNFTPKNAILMVVGRVEKDAFRKAIIGAFGAWQGEAPTRERKIYADPRIKTRPGQVLVVDRPGLNQAQVRLGFRAPLLTSPAHYPFAVVNALLGEYFNSRLNALIRDQLSLTYGINSMLAYSQYAATFTIASSTRNESVGQLLERTADVLKELKQGGVSAEEARTARDFMIGGFPLSTATLGAVASRWLAGYIFEMGPGYLNEFIPRVGAVTAEEASQTAARYLDLDHLTIVVAGDAKEIEKSLAKSRFKSVRRVSAQDLK